MIFSLWEKIKLRNLNNINTNNLAKLNENNTFNGANTFNGTIMVPNPTQSNQAATKEYVDTKFNSVPSMDTTNLAKLNQSNTFSGSIISTSNNNNFISRNDAVSLFKVQRNNGDDLLWIGKKDPNSNQVYISSKAEHIVIEAPAGKVIRFDAGGGINAVSPLTLGTEIKMGSGASVIRMTAEDGTNKKIALGPSGGRGKLDIDLENNAKIINVPNPVSDKDVANKEYVDSKVTSGGSNGPQMLLVKVRTTSSITVAPQDFTYVSWISLNISNEIKNGNWDIVNIMFNGEFSNHITKPMVITETYNAFSGETFIYFIWHNLSTTQYEGQPYFNIVLVKNVNKQIETRNTKSLEDLKKELGEKLQELEVVSIEELK